MRTPKPFYRAFNDCWYVQLGKRQIKLAKGEANEQAAYRRYYEVMAEAQLGYMPDPLPDPKVAAVCDQFLDWCQKHNAPRTYQWYQVFLQDFCNHCGRMKVMDLKPFHVNKWLDCHPAWKEARRGAIIAVKRVFNWAVDEGLLTASPIKALKKPQPRRRERVLTAEEKLKLLGNYKEADPFREFLAALLETGARPGEIAAVTAIHVDLKNGLWIFERHKTAKRTKEPKPRVIVLTPAMVALTIRLIDIYPEGPLFRNRKGKAWDRNAIRCRFRRVRKKLGLGDDVVAYTARHSYATDALAQGVPDATVAELMGHQDTSMLYRHYAKLAQKLDHLKAMAQKAVPPPGDAA